jgi:hypothetical protein
MDGQNKNTRQEGGKGSAAKRELSEREVALYTADMMLELRQLAKGAGLVTLQSLIELVYYEAFATANPVKIPAGEKERLDQLSVQAARGGAG